MKIRAIHGPTDHFLRIGSDLEILIQQYLNRKDTLQFLVTSKRMVKDLPDAHGYFVEIDMDMKLEEEPPCPTKASELETHFQWQQEAVNVAERASAYMKYLEQKASQGMDVDSVCVYVHSIFEFMETLDVAQRVTNENLIDLELDLEQVDPVYLIREVLPRAQKVRLDFIKVASKMQEITHNMAAKHVDTPAQENNASKEKSQNIFPSNASE